MRWRYFSYGSAKNRVDSLATIVIVCVLDFAIWGSFFCLFFVTGLRGGQKDDAEVFQRKHVKVAFSYWSGNSSCHKVRSSRTSTGNLPTLVLNDLTLWHEEMLDCKTTQQLRSTNRGGMDNKEVRRRREKIRSGRGERDKRQVLRSKTPSSEKSKTQLLRSWTFFPKNLFFL